MEKLKARLRQSLEDASESGTKSGRSVDRVLNTTLLALKQMPSGENNLPKILDDNGESRIGTEKDIHHPVTPILQFYSKLPGADEVLLSKVRESAREMLLEKKNDDLLSHDELKEVYMIFEEFAGPSFKSDDGDKFMGYRNYKRMLPTLSKKCQKMLDPTLTDPRPAFMKLITDDPYMRVPITTLFNYIMRKTWLRQTRVALSMYDDMGQGYLREPQLENYIGDLVPSLTHLSKLDPKLLPFYLCTVARKFFFFLDPNKTGRIKILDILASGLVDGLLDLRETEPPSPNNWFSLESLGRVYGHYIHLDKDESGMLSPGELIMFSNGEMRLTSAFVNRVFQECPTFDGEMDFRTYLDFVLAIDNSYQPQSIKYLFKIMDIDHKGYLDAYTLQFFYRDIFQMMMANGTERVCFNDVKDEIFDMIKPQDPLKITLQDLLQSGCGPVLFSIFTDFNGFWSHENKEIAFVDQQARMGSTV